jgi:hypothetical protein
MKNTQTKKLSIDTPIALTGIVKAIYEDTIHVQIGGKIIPIPISHLQPQG